jgi:hypothetical protein
MKHEKRNSRPGEDYRTTGIVILLMLLIDAWLNGLFESSVAIGRLASATHILHFETQANWRAFDRIVISQSRTLIDIETSFVKAVDTWTIIDLWDKETNDWDPTARTYYLNERLIEFDTEVRQWFYLE